MNLDFRYNQISHLSRSCECADKDYQLIIECGIICMFMNLIRAGLHKQIRRGFATTTMFLSLSHVQESVLIVDMVGSFINLNHVFLPDMDCQVMVECASVHAPFHTYIHTDRHRKVDVWICTNCICTCTLSSPIY